MDLTVVVATFGTEDWRRMGARTAARTFEAHGVPVVVVHGDTLHGARNDGLARVRTEWACHLDADDEIDAGFVDAVAAGEADVRAPAVRYVRGRTAQPPRMPRVAGHRHDCEAACLPAGNWLVVGSVVRTELARRVGWRDWPLFEDWDFWLRCHLAGASFEAVPSAVYRAHVRSRSRNRAPGQAERLAAHRAIAEANGVDL